MLIYYLLAISFAFSSAYFIHIRGLRMFNKSIHPVGVTVYTFVTAIGFPYVLWHWLLGGDDFVRAYGEEFEANKKGK